MGEDLVFRADCATYGVSRTRYVCPTGHSVYVQYAPLAERPRPLRCCSICGEPTTQGYRCDRCCRKRKPVVTA